MARLVNGVVIRTCRVCGITEDLIDFISQKDMRTGRYYTHNICRPCKNDYNYSVKYNKVSKKELSRKAAQWNKDNRERYNARRRKPWVLKGISKLGRKKV